MQASSSHISRLIERVGSKSIGPHHVHIFHTFIVHFLRCQYGCHMNLYQHTPSASHSVRMFIYTLYGTVLQQHYLVYIHCGQVVLKLYGYALYANMTVLIPCSFFFWYNQVSDIAMRDAIYVRPTPFSFCLYVTSVHDATLVRRTRSIQPIS